MGILKISNLHFSYARQKEEVLKGIDLEVEEGEFLVLCGVSGCGKSTFLRQLKPTLTPYGKRKGEILYDGENLSDTGARRLASEIGFVMQNVNQQIVSEKVWQELAFGLENLGYDKGVIRRRVAEMASYFGMESLFHEKVNVLSGGQKQLLNLASVMVMNPRILLLDEPTSQLDPITASDFLGTVHKINQDLGITVIMTEHRLQEVFPMADRAAVMEGGRILHVDTPAKTGRFLIENGHEMAEALPAPLRIYSHFCSGGEEPLTVCEGRKWMGNYVKNKNISRKEKLSQREEKRGKNELILSCKEVWFRYEKDGPDIVKGADLSVYKGEIYCLLGGNGAGKSTLLSLLAGIHKPIRGKIIVEKKDISRYAKGELYNGILGMVPQDPQTLFLRDTVKEELVEMIPGKDKEQAEIMASLLHLNGLMEQHPYDLSGGEQQRLAIAKILLLQPKILLLDEPTKGLDSLLKREFSGILRELKRQGITIFIVSHDIEFCAGIGDRCGMFFDGGVVSEENASAFFAGNHFYTTSANRMVRNVFPHALTAEDVISSMEGMDKV